MIVVSTDGSALGNPNGSMGWAWADHTDEAGNAQEHHHAGNADAGGATNGTNQIGELCAVLEALRAHPGSESLTIESDSQYAINCATTWIHGWKKNGWKNSKKEPVKNADLIRAIDAEITKREGTVKFVWIKGHAGNAGNEKVDYLARTYAEDCRSKSKDGYLPKEGWESLLASEYSEGTDVPSDAQMLLDGKISDEEYHFDRAVGEDINPDFSAQTKENTQDEVRETTRETSDEIETTTETAHETATAPSPVPGLNVSGLLQFTPPPNTSPSFTGEARFISGSINVSGYVQADGTLRLEPTDFYVIQRHAS